MERLIKNWYPMNKQISQHEALLSKFSTPDLRLVNTLIINMTVTTTSLTSTNNTFDCVWQERLW